MARSSTPSAARQLHVRGAGTPPSASSLGASSSNARSQWGLTSVLFWVFLLSAVCLYAVVVLSPKAWAHAVLENRYSNGRRQLSVLRQQIEYLSQVTHALQHDPDFAAEYARVDLAALPSGEEHIDVDANLAWDTRRAERLPKVRPEPLPWYASLLHWLARSQRVRAIILLAAATITILSFSFLHESQTARVESAGLFLRRMAADLKLRYLRQS